MVGGAYLRDKNTCARTLTKNVRGACTRKGVYMWDTMVLVHLPKVNEDMLRGDSLVPRSFCSSVCTDSDTQKQKSGKKNKTEKAWEHSPYDWMLALYPGSFPCFGKRK